METMFLQARQAPCSLGMVMALLNGYCGNWNRSVHPLQHYVSILTGRFSGRASSSDFQFQVVTVRFA